MNQDDSDVRAEVVSGVMQSEREATLRWCMQHWGLSLGAPLIAGETSAFVAPGSLTDGRPIVLKLTDPGPALQREAAALAHFAGRGAARLLDADLTRGALLLERVLPGEALTSVADDDAAMAIALDIMRRLHRPPPVQHPFPSVSDWAADLAWLRERYRGGIGPLAADLVARAEGIFAELLPTQTNAVVLHGDLHHANILSSARDGWLAIDPKGVIGEAAYEAGALLRNPASLFAQHDAARVLQRRCALLAEGLGVERQRIHDWGLAQALLAAVWGLQDSGVLWQPGVACAELLAELSR
jgi:streptomycin 6-kinase